MNARVHLGEGAPIVRLRWLFTDLPFLDLDTQCVINNRIWNYDQWSDLPVGQLPFADCDFVQDARWHRTDLPFNHMCNPQWLPTGEPWPTDLPDTKYDDNYTPYCCFDQPPDVSEGGFEIGGAAGDHSHYRDPTAGGLVIGGAAGDLATDRDPTAGGLVIGGSIGDGESYTDATEGGIVIGGSIGGGVPHTDPTEGGVEIGGESGDTITTIDPTSGGMVFGGSAGDRYGYVDPASGGLEVGGGSGDENETTDAALGGAEVGGAAGDVFDGGGAPPPGDSCETAPLLALDTPYEYTIPGEFGNYVWKWSLPAGGTYHLNSTGFDYDLNNAFIYSGTDCGGSGGSFEFVHAGCTQLDVPVGGILVLWGGGALTPTLSTWTLSAGLCP